MNPADLRAFACRDWALIAAAKTECRMEQKRGLPLADILELADQLRRHAMAIRPGWPGADEQTEDLVVHLRVSEALRAVAVRSR